MDTHEPTAAEIVALRTDAAEAGDLEQVAICNRALLGDDPKVPVQTKLTRSEALAECARVIADAAAQQD